jgi:hypothetical protein
MADLCRKLTQKAVIAQMGHPALDVVLKGVELGDGLGGKGKGK